MQKSPIRTLMPKLKSHSKPSVEVREWQTRERKREKERERKRRGREKEREKTSTFGQEAKNIIKFLSSSKTNKVFEPSPFSLET